jgi:DNA-binding PadR family transcriptional regulator
MYEFIILAQLMHGPAHGYLIAKILNDMIGPYARLSPGRLYPLLAKLEQNGLIAAASDVQKGQQGDRQLRIYQITDAGQMRFQVLMRDTSSNPGDYQRLFAHKVTAFRFISPAERLRLIEHYLNYCQAHIFHLQGEAEDLVREAAISNQREFVYQRLNTYTLEAILNVMQHTIDQWQLELAWAKSLREREVAQAEQSDADAPLAGRKPGD